TRFDPMKPAPPVTRRFTVSLRSPWTRKVAPSARFGSGSLERLLRFAGVSRAAGHELVRGVERIEGAGVGPPALQAVALERSGLQVVVVHVGDLQLPAAARLERPDHVEDRGV